ncbi:hypothetical protein BKA65DRAFT_599527 [Rhexocercosporidium sp. MPI-PUGE-AT-0058]|nr:hypothetical protein BKA65DRAFT_599527 [Rhexocercosporidium sp. MPI-PUGE-AT-0058]
MRSSTAFSLLAAASLFSLTGAQNDTQSTDDRCRAGLRDSTWFPNGTYNASGSVSVPGFRVNDTYPVSTWTWTRYLVDGKTSGNRTAIAETISLKTHPIQNLTNASSLPYTGCVFVFNDLGQDSNYKNKGNTENGTCNTIFTSECRTHILQTVTTNAASISARASGSRNGFSCPSLFGTSLTGDDSPCEDQWSGTVSSQFLPNNFTDRRNTLEPGCSISNVGNSTLEDEPFFSWQKESTEAGNFTIYDRAVLNALPVLTVAWLKSTSNETAQSVTVGDGMQGWTGAQLMCITANETQLGSRNLTQVERDSEAVKIVGNWAVVGVVGLSIVVGLVL